MKSAFASPLPLDGSGEDPEPRMNANLEWGKRSTDNTDGADEKWNNRMKTGTASGRKFVGWVEGERPKPNSFNPRTGASTKEREFAKEKTFVLAFLPNLM
jgi:hypothetical protein